MTDAIQRALAVWRKLNSYIHQIMKGCKGIRYTFQSTRPDPTPSYNALMKTIEEVYLDCAAVEMLFLEVKYDMMNSKEYSPEQGVTLLKNMWTAFANRLNWGKAQVSKATVHLMQAELAHVGVIEGQLNLFFSWPMFLYDENMPDSDKFDSLKMLFMYLRCWTTDCQLFLEMMPEYLSPDCFIHTADALYLVLTSIFEFVVVHGNIEESIIMHRLFMIAHDFVKMGSIGINWLLLLTKKAKQKQWLRNTLLWDGRSPLSEMEGIKFEIVKAFKIDESKMSELSLYFAECFTDGEPCAFFTPYFIVKLYDAVVRQAIQTAKSTYTQMRKTLIHALSLAFPPNELMTKANQVLFDVKNYFANCFEVLRLCKKSIEDARDERDIYSMEFSTSNLVLDEVYHSTLEMGEPKYVDACKQAVRKLVHDDYAISKATMHEAMVEFVVNISSKIAETGIHPLDLNSTYARFREAVSTYQGIMIELQDVGTLDGSTWLMTGGRGMDEAKTELISRFNRCYESLKGLKGTGRPTNWGFVLQRLPVTKDLKVEINRLRQVPFSPKPKTYRTILPPPVEVNYLQMKVFDLKNLQPEDEDIVTNEEFQTLLKGHSRAFKRYQLL